MSDALPWYMRDTTTDVDATPEQRERYLRGLANQASPEADQYVASLKAAEARGVQISPTDRMAAGYAQASRKAAALLAAGDSRGNGPSASSDDLTADQRIARGYGGAA
ncbi:hypothetical protein [Streptomyces sp. Cmuel-A718b]|uniref:hypothetical protein n=1 Tax=Streptomyces sp. Cmuel-A718b TaxID=697328 RepID=UPI00081D62A3|nr:hypothetical protein [Streptomyces sp. Cmuel-A718b]SCF58253.1 hypothetical protein GA0115280_102531 [Streptomyces sp. Cmuel-A718b]